MALTVESTRRRGAYHELLLLFRDFERIPVEQTQAAIELCERRVARETAALDRIVWGNTNGR